jgi:UMF1 family MFS transporter
MKPRRSLLTDRFQGNAAAISWALYDWANSAFATTVMAGFFPIFFKMYYSSGTDVAHSTFNLGIANSLAGFIVALSAPFLGTLSDYGGYKKRFLALFCFLGVLMTSCLGLVGQGQWGLATFLYAMGSLGYSGSNVFYDSLLPTVSSRKNVDFVSSLGYALGYLGGGLLFALNVVMYQKYEWFGFSNSAQAIKGAFFSVGLWWLLFSVPLFLFVKEPIMLSGEQSSLTGNVKRGLKELGKTVKSLPQLKSLMFFLIAFFLYNDGVGTTIKMAVDYGMSIGFKSSDLILALLLVQFVGFPAALLFAKLAARFHPKVAIYVAIAVYMGVVVWASQMNAVWEFFAMSVCIGMVQGGIQALSRSYYSRLIPDNRAGEFYGFYNLMGKFNGIVGPLLISLSILFFGNQRMSILSVSLLFLGGWIFLAKVDEKKAAIEARSSMTLPIP